MINQTPTDTTDEVAELLDDKQLQDIKKKSVSGAGSYFFRTILLNIVGIVTSLILSGYLSQEDFGIYGYVTQFIGLLVFFSDVGLGASLIQKKQEPSLSDYRTAFTIQQILSWVIFILVLLLAFSGIVQAKAGLPGVWLLIALGISFPLTSLRTISSIMMERNLLFSKLVIPQMVEQLAFNIALIVLALKGFGVMSYTYAVLLRSILGVVVTFIIQPWSIGFELNSHSIKTLLHFGAKFQINDFLARIKDQLFFILLGSYLPLREFGIISWSKNWSMYPYNLTVQNVMAVTFPTFSRLQHNKDALKRAIEKSLFFITAAIFPLIVGMSVFIYPVTHVVVKYQKWQPAILSFVLFTLSIGWSAVSSPLTNTLNAIGEINTTLKLMVMWTILTWVLTPLCVIYFGFQGVAIASFVIAFSSVVPMYYVKKIIPIDVWDQVWRQLFASAVMAVFGILLMQVWSQNMILMFVGMVAVSAVYCITMGIFGWKKILFEVRSLLSKE